MNIVKIKLLNKYAVVRLRRKLCIRAGYYLIDLFSTYKEFPLEKWLDIMKETGIQFIDAKDQDPYTWNIMGQQGIKVKYHKPFIDTSILG